MAREEREPVLLLEGSLHPRFLFLLDYFGVQALGEIPWAHRVNTKEALGKAFESKVCFLEADVRLDSRRGPVMRHDPLMGEEETLSLRDWLGEVFSFFGAGGVGIKLDFKEPQAVAPSLIILRESDFPSFLLILHANVFSGPDGREPPFEKEDFASQCRSVFPESILSFGFTTSPGCPPFSSEEIKKALWFAQNFQPATVCIRVELAADWIREEMIRAGVAGTLWSDQDARLGRKWWQNYGLRIINGWKDRALMDFPDLLS